MKLTPLLIAATLSFIQVLSPCWATRTFQDDMNDQTFATATIPTHQVAQPNLLNLLPDESLSLILDELQNTPHILMGLIIANKENKSRISSIIKSFTVATEGKNLASALRYVAQFSKLQVLNVAGNKFTDGLLPPIIGDLTSLTSLNLFRCNLTTLPQKMSNLTKLRVLNVAGNEFSDGLLPPVIGDLTALKRLDLSSCNLTTLPQKISNLTKLQVLDVSANNFADDQALNVICKLSTLRHLDIGFCQVTALPNELASLPHLQSIKIIGTRIGTMRPSFNDHVQVKEEFVIVI